MLVTLSWAFSFVNIIGTFLNIKKIPISYFIWTVCNIFWVYYDIVMNIHSRILIDVIQLFMSSYGFIIWTKHTKNLKKFNSYQGVKNCEF